MIPVVTEPLEPIIDVVTDTVVPLVPVVTEPLDPIVDVVTDTIVPLDPGRH